MADHVSMAVGVTHTIDNLIDAAAPLADALVPFVGPWVMGAAPWLSAFAAAAILFLSSPAGALVVRGAYWVVSRTKTNLDNWILDLVLRGVAFLVRLATGKRVDWRESGEIKDLEAKAAAAASEAGLSADEVADLVD